MSETKVKSIFMQRKAQSLYTLHAVVPDFSGDDTVIKIEKYADNNEIDINKIGECEIDMPLLEIGESFFLCDVNKIVVIKDRMRNSNGSITYFVEDELVETEESKKSYERCEEQLLNYNETIKRFNELKKKIKRCCEKYPYICKLIGL